MSFGGDILKFSGDAFLSSWKCKDDQILRQYVYQAIDCALVIQKNYGTYKTDIGTQLRVKLAISAGPVIFTLIGNEKYSHYIITGKPVEDVKEAEHRSKAGEIVVAPSAWYHVNAADYISVKLEGSFRKVVGVGPSWRHIVKEEIKYSTVSRISEDVRTTYTLDSDNEEKLAEKRKIEFTLRPIMHRASDVSEDLRKFILPPVMTCIDRDEPIDYLIEMRRTVIMFINLTSKRSSYDTVAYLVSEWYIKICENAETYRGCVNKVSLFDKDIMFVLIFGLRGFKHDLECQYALKCASATFECMNAHKDVKTVSIAVTTGNTYCGIVGHTLRREYTVMSLIVNKAARIMVNYPERVACDYSTFQFSKLEAKYFILQASKDLKGITNPGPIYEFQRNYIRTVEQASISVNYYPILGREAELKLYLENLMVFIHYAQRRSRSLDTYTRMIIVKGLPRQGKTRLLEEFIYRTDPAIPITTLVLSNSDSRVEYSIAKLILIKILGFENKCSEEVRKKIYACLENTHREYLSCMNDIFDVDFDPTPDYLNMSEQDKSIIMGGMLIKLCYSVLPSIWIVTVDNAKHMDEGSWRLLASMLACRYLFFVISLDAYYVAGPMAKKMMMQPYVQILQLNNLPIEYHAALACQILRVFAISPDLEHLLNSKSNGNPGWMESLLVGLKQSNNLLIKSASYGIVYEHGLVAPPLYMMRRMTPENILKWKQLMEEKTSKTKETNIDNWHIYIDTCRDKMVDVDLRDKIHRDLTVDKNFAVCFLNPKFNSNDVEGELSREGYLIMTFDSLTYHEQLLLKCSSILGDSFPRTMLTSVMQGDKTFREVALAVKSLFEKKVICCARGDFTDGGNYTLFRDRMVDPSEDSIVKCSCLGLYISQDVRDLPKYASCGYIRFISSRFRQATYNLLTDPQKKIFHARAAKYILMNTRRCSACGGGFFDLCQYCTIGEKFKVKRRNEMGLSTLTPHRTERSSTISSSIYTPTATSPRSSRRESTLKRSFQFTGHDLILRLDDEDADSIHIRDFGILNPFKVLRYKENTSLTKPFEGIDFRTCHCQQIQTYAYDQLIRHYKGTGQGLELINSRVHYIISNVVQENYPEALICVMNSLRFLSTSRDTLRFPDWKIAILEAKVYTWYGVILAHQEQRAEAMNMLQLAMTKFGYPFPKSKFSLHIKLWTKKLHLKLGIYLYPDEMTDKKLNDADKDVLDSVSSCLNKMFNIFLQSNKYEQAELSAVWSLTKAVEAGKRLYQVCEAFGNMILMANYKKNKFLSLALEVHALRYCHRKKYIDPPELKAVIKLYYIIFETRLARAEYDESLHIGYIMTNLTIASNHLRMTVKAFAQILLILVVKLFLTECTTILEELYYYTSQLDTPEGRADLYFCCLLYHMETGYNFLPFKDIEKFYRAESLQSPSPAQTKFLLLLRTWYSRTHQWEAAKIVNEQMASVPRRADATEKTIHMAFCLQALYEMEYQLMMFVNKINKRNIYDKVETRANVTKLRKKMEKHIDYAPLAKPRYHLLKAYEAIIYNDESKMLKNLRICRKYATEQGNFLQANYADFLETYWMDKMPEKTAGEWFQHASPDDYVEYNPLDHEDKVFLYPFPLPVFY
ncbi:hypothetical protein HHI36_021415 [Cryptolaemus montrouzieri]